MKNDTTPQRYSTVTPYYNKRHGQWSVNVKGKALENPDQTIRYFLTADEATAAGNAEVDRRRALLGLPSLLD